MSKPEEMPLSTSEPRPRVAPPEHHISITPLDMRQARFSTSMRGFAKANVTSFLQEAAEGFEQALRENERLRIEIVKLETSLNQFRELEGSLKTTLMTAQKTADDLRDTARKEAERLVREAEGRVELMMQKAQAKTEDVEREIDSAANRLAALPQKTISPALGPLMIGGTLAGLILGFIASHRTRRVGASA